MAKAIKLQLKPEYNFFLIGIVSAEPIYRLGWLLNEQLLIKLTENKTIEIKHAKTGVMQQFAQFTFFYEELDVYYELIQNKGQNGVLIEEQKNIDYFLKISEVNEQILPLIKSINEINLAVNIEPGSLKSKQRLLCFNYED